MGIHELIEYSKEHRKILNISRKIGIDTTTFEDPKLEYESVECLKELAQYNIKVRPEHIHQMNELIQARYLRTGDCAVVLSDDYKYMEPDSVWSTDDQALLEHLGITRMDITEDELIQLTEDRLGKSLIGDY